MPIADHQPSDEPPKITFSPKKTEIRTTNDTTIDKTSKIQHFVASESILSLTVPHTGLYNTNRENKDEEI